MANPLEHYWPSETGVDQDVLDMFAKLFTGVREQLHEEQLDLHYIEGCADGYVIALMLMDEEWNELAQFDSGAMNKRIKALYDALVQIRDAQEKRRG